MLSSTASVLAGSTTCLPGSVTFRAKRTSAFKKGPAPRRATRSLAVETQSRFGGGGGKAVGPAYICKDCGYIESNFEAQDKGYRCPVCNAPKRRFGLYKEPVSRNANSTATRKARKEDLQGGAAGGGSDRGPNPAVLVGAAVFVLAALYIGLNASL